VAAIRDITPMIWRDFSIDARDTLVHLHRTFQTLFGWEDYHLFEFVVRGIEFPEIDDDFRCGIDPAGVTLQDLDLAVGDSILYRYDYGDDWQVELRLTDVSERPPAVVFPRCSDGGRAGPPEDCGGVGGYEDLLRVLADPTDDEHEHYRQWAGPNWDPEYFSPSLATKMMAGISRPSARKRSLGQKAYIPAAVRIAAEWRLLSFCNERRGPLSPNPVYYELERRKNAFTLFRHGFRTLADGSRYPTEDRVARFTYLADSSEWRLDWPNSTFTWRPAWHTSSVRDIGKLIEAVAESESEMEFRR
jgi:hypothetical protein